MRRASPRRILFCLGGLVGGVYLLGNIHQTFKSVTVNVMSHYEIEAADSENKTVLAEITEIKESANSDESKPELSSSVVSALPWYMESGLVRPSQPQAGGKRKLSLFPDETSGEDRIASKAT